MLPYHNDVMTHYTSDTKRGTAINNEQVMLMRLCHSNTYIFIQKRMLGLRMLVFLAHQRYEAFDPTVGKYVTVNEIAM